MIVTEGGSLQSAGLRRVSEFDEVRAIRSSRAERLDAVRSAAERFRRRFGAQGQVHGVRVVDLSSAGYPVRYAFSGAARATPTPWVSVVARLVIVQYEDFSGATRLLCWRPHTTDGPPLAPFERRLAERYASSVPRRVLSARLHTVREALALYALTPADVHFVAFDHLRGQDMRTLMGATRPVEGEPEPRDALFPDARFLLRRTEVETARSAHPSQRAWYVPGGMRDVVEDRLVELEDDVELGVGVALLASPGHTEGSQCLVLRTPDGVCVFSGNGVAADNWHPHLSKIPGVRKEAELMSREVIFNSDTVDSAVEQYDSMVKEKTLAEPNRTDPRWMNVIPSSEIRSWRRSWPIAPSFSHGELSFGRVQPLRENGTP